MRFSAPGLRPEAKLGLQRCRLCCKRRYSWPQCWPHASRASRRPLRLRLEIMRRHMHLLGFGCRLSHIGGSNNASVVEPGQPRAVFRALIPDADESLFAGLVQKIGMGPIESFDVDDPDDDAGTVTMLLAFVADHASRGDTDRRGVLERPRWFQSLAGSMMTILASPARFSISSSPSRIAASRP